MPAPFVAPAETLSHASLVNRSPLLKTLLLLLLTQSITGIKVSCQQTQNEDDVVRVSTDLLVFPIRIKEAKKTAPTEVGAQTFSLKDPDGVTNGLYLWRGTDRVSLVFALDESGSLREIIGQQQEAALALFDRFGERSTVAVLRFSETPKLITPFGRDLESAKQSFSFPPVANRHTAIFDAAAASVRLFDNLKPVRAERRIVVLISDGLDNASQTSSATVVNAALNNHVSFYVIHLPLFAPRNGHLEVRSPAKGFRELAEKTGGQYFLIGTAHDALAIDRKQDLTAVFAAIEKDLRSQYLLGFYIRDGARDGKTHHVSIAANTPDFVYSVANYGYKRQHEFVVNLVPNSPPSRN